MVAVANCIDCKRIFKKQYSPRCAECHQIYMTKLSNVYRFVQENPHLTLEDIAEQCGLPFRDVETLFFQGKLGTATTQVIYHCQLCNRPMAVTMGQGRFCPGCTEQFESEAGLNEQDTSEKPRSKTQRAREIILNEDIPERPVNEEPAVSETESYGFKRLSSESF
jgi:hypothetical protein